MSRQGISTTSTPLTPIFSNISLKTIGSLSMVHQPAIVFVYASTVIYLDNEELRQAKG